MILFWVDNQSNNMNWKTERVDEICKNSIWREHLGKESSNSVLNENFRLNPRTMISITDKPGQVNPNLPPPRKKALKDIDETQQALNQALSDACLSPRGKYKEPQTANMEYGWMPDPLVPKSQQFSFGQKSCEITNYTAAYVESLGISPFSNKGGKV